MKVKITYPKTGTVEVREDVVEVNYPGWGGISIYSQNANGSRFSFFYPDDRVKIEIVNS